MRREAVLGGSALQLDRDEEGQEIHSDLGK